MPKLVVPLTQGNSYSYSSDGGGAGQATRKWKVILNEPNETWNVFQTVNVAPGDLYSYGETDRWPCISVEAAPDGESRLVRIVTATYRSNPAVSPTVADPRSVEPMARPALYSMSTTLTEIAAWGGKKVDGTGAGAYSGPWRPNVNPVGDPVDGLSRLEPVVNITIEQYSLTDQSQLLQYTGYVNRDLFVFSTLTIAPHGCMLQSIASTPVVEQFQQTQFRGFKVTFNFAVRANWTHTRNGTEPIGWDMAVPQTGLNVLNASWALDPLYQSVIDHQALSLQHEDGRVAKLAGGQLILADGTTDKKVRAMVTLPAQTKQSSSTYGYVQRPAAQPVPLNDDGTPRNTQSQQDAVLINRICIQPEMDFGNNFSGFGIRWFTVPPLPAPPPPPADAWPPSG